MNNVGQSKIKILLIDDDPTEFDTISLQLEQLKDRSRIVIDYAMSIEAGLNMLSEENYSLVLLDNMLLPNNDFRETVPQLRKARYTGPVGIISNDISEGFFQEIEKYGADFRMAKQELDPETLEYVVTEFTKDNSIPMEL